MGSANLVSQFFQCVSWATHWAISSRLALATQHVETRTKLAAHAWLEYQKERCDAKAPFGAQKALKETTEQNRRTNWSNENTNKVRPIMISFHLVNFLPPQESRTLVLRTASGEWQLSKADSYDKAKDSIAEGKCAETYFLEHPVSKKDGAVCDTALEEITPILLGISYFLGLSVTISRSTMASEISILQASNHWPRERAMGIGYPLVNTDAELIDQVQKFVNVWQLAGRNEKILLLVHHWLDALACWSFEDMYLSVTTLLQVVAATEELRQGKDLSFLQGVSDASMRHGITPLSPDFKNMRNDLIHDGTLSSSRFPGKNLPDCAHVAADVFNWIDKYIHAALGFGPVGAPRFKLAYFANLNAYSL